jgi:hypothetical protein
MQHEGLEIGLVLLHLAVAADALVGDDAHDRVLADDGAFEIDDLQAAAPMRSRPLAGRLERNDQL